MVTKVMNDLMKDLRIRENLDNFAPKSAPLSSPASPKTSREFLEHSPHVENAIAEEGLDTVEDGKGEESPQLARPSRQRASPPRWPPRLFICICKWSPVAKTVIDNAKNFQSPGPITQVGQVLTLTGVE